MQINQTHRTVLRALAETVVPSMQRPEDPTGFWSLSGSDLKANLAVEQALTGLPEQQRAGLLALLDGLHTHGFAAASPAEREQLISGVAQLGPEAAAAMHALVNYALTDEVDQRIARRSLEAQIRLHAAAGAQEIVPFAATARRWRAGEDLEAFIAEMQSLPLGVGGHRLFSAHQMSSCRMGTDPATSVANPWGELHDTPGVYIGDASALPTATGVNPMISTMAMAHRTATAIAQTATTAASAVH